MLFRLPSSSLERKKDAVGSVLIAPTYNLMSCGYRRCATLGKRLGTYAREWQPNVSFPLPEVMYIEPDMYSNAEFSIQVGPFVAAVL